MNRRGFITAATAALAGLVAAPKVTISAQSSTYWEFGAMEVLPQTATGMSILRESALAHYWERMSPMAVVTHIDYENGIVTFDSPAQGRREIAIGHYHDVRLGGAEAFDEVDVIYEDRVEVFKYPTRMCERSVIER